MRRQLQGGPGMTPCRPARQSSSATADSSSSGRNCACAGQSETGWSHRAALQPMAKCSSFEKCSSSSSDGDSRLGVQSEVLNQERASCPTVPGCTCRPPATARSNSALAGLLPLLQGRPSKPEHLVPGGVACRVWHLAAGGDCVEVLWQALRLRHAS